MTTLMKEEVFEKIGLSTAESKIYLASLELGQSLPKHLAEKAGVKRPTLYQILPGLKEKGLISETVRGKRRYLVAEDPETYLETRKTELKQFEDMIPELRLLLNTAFSKPSINFYQGIEGVKKVYMDNLRVGKPMFDFVGLKKIHPIIAEYSRNFYIPERIRRQLPLKMLISGSPTYGETTLITDPKALREVRVVEERKFPCPLDICIYGDNVSFIIYRKDSEPSGIIIRSKEVNTAMLSLFNIAWLAARPM